VIGCARPMIRVVDYDPNWPREFEALKGPLEHALADCALAVEHVGSTAVRGLAAKPVIDLDVVVAAPDVVQGIKRLTTLGYVHRGNLGIPLREAFHRPPGSVAHNLYLCPSHSPALANHLALRDHLRAHPTAARAYGDLKRQLAAAHVDDIDAYVAGKTQFIVSLLRAAGFSEASLAAVASLNGAPSQAPP
jgi:GrpB-like predicted nucleotidyltransferase (UPF0157 family)